MAGTGPLAGAPFISETAVNEPLCATTPADQGSMWSPCSGRFKAERQPQKEEIQVKRQAKGETAEETCGWKCALGRRCSMPKRCIPKGLQSWATHTRAGTPLKDCSPSATRARAEENH